MSTESSAQNFGRPPTSRDVARQAGVSQPTVSRYLNGKTVSPEAAEAIRVAIVELGYRPNQSARSLITARSNLIAVVLGDISNGYYGEIFSTVNAELARNGLRSLIIEGRVGLGSNPGTVLSDVDVDGVIVTTSLMLAAQEELILSSGLPTVFFNRTNITKCDTVHAQNRLGGQLAGELLLELGHRHIGMISGPEKADAIVARAGGFHSALAAHAVKVSHLDMETPGFDYELAYAAAIRLLDRPIRPTGIFCHNDQIAFAALNAAKALSIEVPRELSIIGFDDVSVSAWETINLTTIRQPVREMARVAVELLLKRLKEPGRAVESVTLPCQVVRRGTSGPVL